MRKKRVLPGIFGLLLGAGACAVGPEPARLEAPRVESEDPILGQPFAVEIPRDGDRTLRLEGVRGRITLICILGEAAERVADACAGVRERWQDRVAMVGIWVGEVGDATGLPFRAYVDPGGEALRQGLPTPVDSQVLVLDVRGRIVRRLPLDELENLIDEVAQRMP